MTSPSSPETGPEVPVQLTEADVEQGMARASTISELDLWIQQVQRLPAQSKERLRQTYAQRRTFLRMYPRVMDARFKALDKDPLPSPESALELERTLISHLFSPGGLSHAQWKLILPGITDRRMPADLSMAECKRIWEILDPPARDVRS